MDVLEKCLRVFSYLVVIGFLFLLLTGNTVVAGKFNWVLLSLVSLYLITRGSKSIRKKREVIKLRFGPETVLVGEHAVLWGLVCILIALVIDFYLIYDLVVVKYFKP
jgi:hypothetical protein